MDVDQASKSARLCFGPSTSKRNSGWLGGTGTENSVGTSGCVSTPPVHHDGPVRGSRSNARDRDGCAVNEISCRLASLGSEFEPRTIGGCPVVSDPKSTTLAGSDAT